MPRDLEFNPHVYGELWVVNRADDSVTIISDAGTPDQSSRHVIDPYAFHFMEEVSSISFGAPLFEDSDFPNFGTRQESQNTYNGLAPPDLFMGPTLWNSDPDIFGYSNPEAIDYLSNLYGFYVDLGSHIDMLHQSSDCVGIAWERDNVYWVFDGYNNAIDRNDFVDDHGVGYDDHGDGVISQYMTGELSYVQDVPGHLYFDHSSALLYIADTGASEIKVLDTTTGSRGASEFAWEPGTDSHMMDDAVFWTLIDGEDVGLELPSGLTMVEDHLLVTDNATGVIHAFDLEGNQVDYLDTGLGSGALMGLRATSLLDIWFVDAETDKVMRLQPAE